MKNVTKTLKEVLKASGIEGTLTGYDRDGEIEVMFVQNSHGAFERGDERYHRFDFCVHRGKVLVRKANIGHFQCRFIPWKGEDPCEMYFNFEYI